MEVPRLGVKSELYQPAHATATAMQDPSYTCNPHCSLQQCRILNPLNEARDQTHILTETTLGPEPADHNRNSYTVSFRQNHPVCNVDASVDLGSSEDPKLTLLPNEGRSHTEFLALLEKCFLD